MNIAYQIVGDGPIDLVYCAARHPNLDLMWDEPPLEFEDRGARELKGVPGEWRLYMVKG